MHYLNEHLRKYVTVKSGVNYNALLRIPEGSGRAA